MEDAKSWLDKYDHPLWKKYGMMPPAQVTVEWIGLYSMLSSNR